MGTNGALFVEATRVDIRRDSLSKPPSERKYREVKIVVNLARVNYMEPAEHYDNVPSPAKTLLYFQDPDGESVSYIPVKETALELLAQEPY
jgi:hypothetical protein